jgi:hypothetical protein
MAPDPQEPPRLTPSLAWFVRRHLRSAADLEILLLLWRNQERWFSAEDVARELQAPAAVTRDSLQRLSGSLAILRRGTEAEYRFSTHSEEERRSAEALAALYRHDRFQVLRLIAPPAAAAIQDFADAFELKKKEEEE